MEFTPFVTYFGAENVFTALKDQIEASIPQDSCEWRRSYERPVKNIRLEASFQRLEKSKLEKYNTGSWSIIEHPVLHLFFIESNDIEAYKNGIKEEIENWLSVLNSYGISDWMIVIIETVDVKKHKNILSRTTILDKIRIDFAPKNGDRCVTMLNPIKHEVKATESYRCLLQRIRHFMLIGYNRNIIKYEDLIRANREKRNQEKWCFVKYFFLQEELAFVLEKLGLFLEALVQYDELDAMFSQFVVNSTIGEHYSWLDSFAQPLTTFNGITIDRKTNFDTRKLIVDQKPSLLDFRRYIFERQCILLKEAGTPWEIAERLLPFLFSTLKEIESLAIDTCKGSLDCWEFLCAIEVLNVCDFVMETNEATKCYQYCAPIWNLAKDKLYEIGKLCGLLPGFQPTSDQLHAVVQLSFGIEDGKENVTPITDSTNVSKINPTERLKKALGSNDSFTTLYLELSELAISTYKHVSRLRSARLVGLDLGKFYCSLNEPQKAIVFFNDIMRELHQENWNNLASQTLLHLANCYQKMEDMPALIKTCSAISCCPNLEMLVRTFYFDEFLKCLKNVNSSQIIIGRLDEHVRIRQINIKNEPQILQDEILHIEMVLDSNFPREVMATNIILSFETREKSINKVNLSTTKLPMTSHLDFKQDNTLNCASVVCSNQSNETIVRSNKLTRNESQPILTEISLRCCVENIVLKPGVFSIELKTKANRVGIWNLAQLSILIEPMQFVLNSFPENIPSFTIISKPANAVLCFKNLIAGIEQEIQLIVSGGSFIFSKDSVILLKCSKYLQIKQEKDHVFESENTIELINFKSFEERVFPLHLICDLPGRRDSKPIEHKITLTCPWSRNEMHISVHFLPAIVTTCRLHSAGTKKFLQVIIKGIESTLYLSNPVMTCGSDGVNLKCVNPKNKQPQKISKNINISYLWEVEVEPLQAECELPIIHVNFSIEYAQDDSQKNVRPYFCRFDVTDYTTLFRISAKVDQSELCRVGSVCHMAMKISKLQDNQFTELMYEVLADQHMWAVCGRSAGVISMADCENLTLLMEILPLTAGFLPLPNIRLSKYISVDKKKDLHPMLQPFPPGQVYNATKSVQIQVLASNSTD